MSFEASIDIAAPRQRVFAYLTQPELIKTWQLDVPEPAPLPEGGLRIGLKQEVTVAEYGRTFRVETLLVDLKLNELLAYEMDSPNALVRSEYRLAHRPETTVVRQMVTARPRRWMRMIWPIAEKFFECKVRSRLQLLKQKVEEEAQA